MDEIYNKSIILIGGMAIGKSTIAKELSKKTGMKYISTDAYKDRILEANPDYSFEKQLKIREKYGFKGEKEFLLPYLLESFKQLLDNLKEPSIIDVGALSTFIIDEELRNKLSNYKQIINLYSENIDEILKRRNIDKNSELGIIYQESHNNLINEDISTKSINIDNKNIEEIIKEITNKKTLI